MGRKTAMTCALGPERQPHESETNEKRGDWEPSFWRPRPQLGQEGQRNGGAEREKKVGKPRTKQRKKGVRGKGGFETKKPPVEGGGRIIVIKHT